MRPSEYSLNCGCVEISSCFRRLVCAFRTYISNHHPMIRAIEMYDSFSANDVCDKMIKCLMDLITGVIARETTMFEKPSVTNQEPRNRLDKILA